MRTRGPASHHARPPRPRARTVVAGALLAGLWSLPAVAVPPAAGAAAPAGEPLPPARALETVSSGTVTVAWSPPAPAPSPRPSEAGRRPPAASGYVVAPIVGGIPCARCAGADTVRAPASAVTLGSAGGTVALYAVRAIAGTGVSPWVRAVLPDLPAATATPPPSRSSHVTPAAGPWIAAPVPAGYTSPLDTPPAGWSRTVIRDDGFSAPTADDGDLWVFGDTTVLDTPGPGTGVSGTASCFTRDGTAAVAPPALPPHLEEAVESVAEATAGGATECTGSTADLPSDATEPYQLLGDYPGDAPGVVCANWVDGLANQAAGGRLSDTVTATYSANCLDGGNALVGLGGTWTATVTPTGAGAQRLSLPLGSQDRPDLPVARCPAAAFTGFDGSSEGSLLYGSGNYGSVLPFDGDLYFYEAYGDSTYAFAGLGIPEATCASMALARVPAADAADPADYQYLTTAGWQSPAGTGRPAAQLAQASADVMAPDYDGAYAGQVDVTTLADGELVMAYVLPAPLHDARGGTDVAAVRTARTPWGPWSAPAPVEIPGFVFGDDYQLLVHPELSTPAALALSYVVAADDGGGVIGRRVTFATLPTAGLPVPGARPAQGYVLGASDGGAFAYGDAGYRGSMGGRPLDAPVVGMAATPDGAGYWEVAADGGIFAFGDATFYGSMGGRPLFSPVVGMAADPAGGYWEVAADGGIFAFDAPFMGSMGSVRLRASIVALVPTSDGGGYWEVAADGGVFAFGGARFAGAPPPPGGSVSATVTAAGAGPGGGYWEVEAGGGVFAYGAARYLGSMGGRRIDAPVVAVAPT